MFRQEAIDNHKNKWRGRALLLPGVPFWTVATLCLFFIFTFLVFVIEGTYTRRVNVTGEITTYPRAANVYSTVQGVVVKEFVSEGQAVDIGDQIYQIDVSKSTKNGVVSDNQRKDIDAQIERISNIIALLKNSKQNTLDMLGKQKIEYRAAFQHSSEIIKRSQEGLQMMRGNMENYQAYQTRGLITKDQLTNQVAIYYQQQNSQLGLTWQNEQNALQITALESQIQTQAAEFDNQIYQMELQRYELKKERLNTDASGDIFIRALSKGRINSLSVTVGQMVNVGDSLLQITPGKIDHYSLVIWVPNDSIPYITAGDKVNVRYEAFPAERFGQFAGTVSVISKTPASSQEMLTYQGAPKNALTSSIPYYKVLVIPEKQTVVYDGKRLNLENGMKAESTLFLEKRKVYQWMLSPLYDIKRSTTGAVNE